MSGKTFHLIATVSTDNAAAVLSVLKEFIGKSGTVEKVRSKESPQTPRGEFRVEAKLEGATAKELNRSLLSAVRKVEKKTRLRAAWSSGGVIEQYFDYVLKKTATEK